MASALVVLTSVLLNPDAPLWRKGLTLTLLALMALRWIGWNRAGRTHPADILLETITVVAVVSLFSNPAGALWFVYGGIYYRPLIASSRETLFATTAYISAFCTGIALSAGSIDAILSPSTLVQLPAMFLVAAVVRIVSVTLERNSRITNELRRAGNSYRALIEQLPGAVLISDGDARIHYISPRIYDILGYQAEAFIGPVEGWLRIIHPEDREHVSTTVREALEADQSVEFESRAIRSDGSVAWIRVESLLVSEETDSPNQWRGIVTDITEPRRLEDELIYQASHDPLTDLPNRAHFEERLAHTVSLQSRGTATHAVLFLDLDQFKVVNDTLGHHTGDMLLIEASARIAGCVRETDTVARVGGDEFAVLLEDLHSQDEAIRISRRIVEQMTVPFLLNGHLIHISTSIGIAFTDDTNQGPSDLVRQADVAMYAAKRAGKARHVVYDPEMDKQAWERLQIEADLYGALDRQEFVVHYQPVVDLSTGNIQEMEALVRWQHPTRGLVPPGDFLTVADEIGLMATLDRWVLEQACGQARAWQRRFADHAELMVCVNLSPALLREPSLAAYVSSVLESTGLAPNNLKLEVTEHAMIADIELGHQAINDLHEIGVHIAIDDFGTGNSALGYLRRLPVDTLKIDRSYVAEIDESPQSLKMIAAVITLAKSLGLIVTAEGIEQRHQTRLRAIGCDLGQGFYFDRPLPASDLEKILHGANAYGDHLDGSARDPVVTFVREQISARQPEAMRASCE